MSKYILTYIRYAFILFVLIVLYLFNNHPVTLVLLILAFFIPAVSVLGFLLAGRRFDASLSFSQSMMNRNVKGNLSFRIENHSPYPHSKLTLTFRVRKAFGTEEYTHKISLYVGPFSSEVYVLPLSFEYCGLYYAELLTLSSSDLFDFVGFHKKCDSVSELVILPGLSELSGNPDNVKGSGEDDDDYREEHARGEDRSEIFDIREYAVGDKLQTIHWKLSAKSEKLLVKEFSDLSGEQFQIFTELAYADNQQMDAFYDLLWTVTQYFCKQKMKFSVCYIDSKDSFRHIRIHNEEDIISVIMQLYYEKPAAQEGVSVRQYLGSLDSLKNCYLITNRLYSRGDGMSVLCSNKNTARIYQVTK